MAPDRIAPGPTSLGPTVPDAIVKAPPPREPTTAPEPTCPEVASKMEAQLRDKFGVDSDLTGVELVDFILTTELEKVKGKGDEDITAHPEYLKLKRCLVSVLKRSGRPGPKNYRATT